MKKINPRHILIGGVIILLLVMLGLSVRQTQDSKVKIYRLTRTKDSLNEVLNKQQEDYLKYIKERDSLQQINDSLSKTYNELNQEYKKVSKENEKIINSINNNSSDNNYKFITDHIK